MRKFIFIFIPFFCLFFATLATAAVITISLNSVPTYLECDTGCLCDQNWVVSDVVLSVTSTTTGDPCASNDCNWEHTNSSISGNKGIALSPGRLIVDLSSINDPIIRVRVEIDDYCSQPYGCSYAAIYNGTTLAANPKTSAEEGPAGGPGWFEFNTTNIIFDKLIFVSCNGFVDTIRITTTTTSPTSSTCGIMCSPTQSTCGYVCSPTLNTCGYLCGPTQSTCGYVCGPTQSTCSYVCSPTLNTCSYVCSPTLNTCGYVCSPTQSTCGYVCSPTQSTCGYVCSPTLSTCGYVCGPTQSTCSIGCGSTSISCATYCDVTQSTCGAPVCSYTSTWCQYPTLYGTGTFSSRLKASDTPGPTPAY